VSLVSSLYQRFRTLIHEGSKFLVIGGIGFVVTEVGFNLCRFSFGLGLFTSNALATIAATAITFIGNRYWTFRHRQGQGTARESTMFVVLNGVGLLIQYGCVWLAQNVLGFPHDDKFSTNVALLIGIALGTLFRFWSYRRWVWAVLPPAGATPALQEATAGHESRQPALVPPEPLDGHGRPNGTGAGPGQAGRQRPGGPRHSRSR
jgi:putative flippase GtrA